MALPSGVIACLFSDIEGSTRLLRRLGERYEELLDLHHRVLRDAWAAHHGHEVSTTGDGFFVVFEQVGDAVAGAVAAQRALRSTTWPTELPVRVRMGIHTGYARPVEDDYTALVVHQAARVVDAAHGGQILVSGAAMRSLATAEGGVRLQPLGRFRVRDFEEPVELHAVRAQGLPEVRAAPRVKPADGHNVVRPTSSLVDRVDEVRRLRETVRPGTVTTIVGPGGVGKTRLVLETALTVAADWEDGAWFVDLAPLEAPELMRGAIADAVGAPAVPGVERWEEVLDHLRDREALVILDNCEHLVTASAAVAAELLSACPGVGVLATSRIPLGLRAERVHRLAPLASDGPRPHAVELFLQRSSLDDDADRSHVGELCAELDGLPLAIELAAARTSAVTPREILVRLRRSPSILRSRDPTLPERQRTLERLLDWSADLLEEDARCVLWRLTAFAGSFDLEAAEVVGAGDDLSLAEVDELLWGLVDASLVVNESAAGSTRYRLLVTVRAYASAQADPEDLAAAVDRAARLYLERLGPEAATGRSWVTAMSDELDNVRQVVGRTREPAVAQALASSIGRYHDATEAFRTGIEETTSWLLRLSQPTSQRVGLLTTLADLHLRLGGLEDGERLLAEATGLAAEVGVPAWDAAGIPRTRGELALRRGDPASAVAEAEAALEIELPLRDRARLYSLLGIAAGITGDLTRAVDAFEQELQVATEAGAVTFLASTQANLAEVHLRRGDAARAADRQLIALRFAREHDESIIVAFSLMIAARLVGPQRRPREALVLQTVADRLLEQASFALYEEDELVRSKLLAAAVDALGKAESEAARAEAVTLDTDGAAELAEAVLAQVGSAAPDPEAVR